MQLKPNCFGISARQRALVSFALKHFCCSSAVGQSLDYVPIVVVYKCNMRTIPFSLCCRFCVLWQSSDFCLAFCTHSHDSHCVYRCSGTEHIVKLDLRKGIGHFNLFSLHSATWNFWWEVFMSRIVLFTLDWIKRIIFQVTGQSPS